MNLERAAAELLDREDRAVDGAPLTGLAWSDLTIEQAYRIQDLTLELRLARGETLVGVKLGLTSVAKQKRMGVDAPFVAWLTDAMMLAPETPVPSSRLIHPRAEPEIAFVMGRRLSGGHIDAVTALAATSSVHAAVEIIDSRYRDFIFTAPDVIADNASSSFVLMDPTPHAVGGRDLAMQTVLVESQGRVLDSATGAAILGHPAEALAFAARVLAARGLAIEPGWIVLCGAMTDAYALDLHSPLIFDFGPLGTIHVRGDSLASH